MLLPNRPTEPAAPTQLKLLSQPLQPQLQLAFIVLLMLLVLSFSVPLILINTLVQLLIYPL